MLIISFLLILNLHWSLGEKIIIEQLNAEFNSYVLRSSYTNELKNYFFTLDISLPFSDFTKIYINNNTDKLIQTDSIDIDERTYEASYIIDNFFFITAALELMTYMSLILIDNYSNRIQLGLDTLMLILTIRLYGDYTTKVKVIGKYLR